MGGTEGRARELVDLLRRQLAVTRLQQAERAQEGGERGPHLVGQERAHAASQVVESTVALAPRGFAPRQAGVDRIDEIADSHRLRQVVVGARTHSRANVVGLVETRQEEEGQGLEPRIAAQSREHAVPVQFRKLDVADHEVGQPAPDGFESGQTFDGLRHVVALFTKSLGQECAEGTVVLDQYDAGHALDLPGTGVIPS